jgi:acetylglutamate kinase
MENQKSQLNVIKIGGNIIDNPIQLEQFLTDFATLDGFSLLVHGGGKIATEMAKELGIQSQMIDGRRVTDEASLRIVSMVYAGWINKSIVGKLQGLGKNALGLSGPDGQLVLSKKRSQVPIDYGFVGDIEKINGFGLHQLMTLGYHLVFAPITADSTGQLLNTNADTMAQALAIALSEFYQVNLIYCFEKQGVLLDPENDDSVISSINQNSFDNLKSKGIVSAGMIPKLENALKAISQGVYEVQITHAKNVKFPSKGTTIKA